MSSENNLQKGSLIKTYKAELFLLIVTFTWGLSFPLIKTSLKSISPFLFVSIRFLITLIAFLLIYKKKITISNFAQWKYGLILGFFMFVGFGLQTVGLEYTTASKSAFITGITLVLIPFAQYFILKTRPKTENMVGALIVMAGLYILTEAYFSTPNFGDILTFFCTFSFAIHIVLLTKYSEFASYEYLLFGQFLMMVILGFVFTLFGEVFVAEKFKFELNTALIISLIFTSVFSTLIAIILMTKYQHDTTPLRAGIIYNMESVFAVFFAYIMLGEILNFSQLVGVGIMVIGLLISEFYSFFKFKISDEDSSKDNC